MQTMNYICLPFSSCCTRHRPFVAICQPEPMLLRVAGSFCGLHSWMKTKQMDMQHTREGIRHGHQLARQVEDKLREWSRRRGEQNQSRRVWNAEWDHHYCLQVPRPQHGQKVGGGRDMSTRNEDLVITDQIRSTRNARHQGITQGSADPGSGLNGSKGDPMMTEGTEPSRQSMVVVKSVAQAWAGGEYLGCPDGKRGG
jgi:hypothetical protein